MLKEEEGKNDSIKGKSTGVRATNGTPAMGGEEIGKTYRVSKFLSQSPTLAHGACRFSNIQLVNRSSSFRYLQMESFSPFQPHIQST